MNKYYTVCARHRKIWWTQSMRLSWSKLTETKDHYCLVNGWQLAGKHSVGKYCTLHRFHPIHLPTQGSTLLSVSELWSRNEWAGKVISILSQCKIEDQKIMQILELPNMFVLSLLKHFLETDTFHLHLEKPVWKEMFCTFTFKLCLY